MEDKNLNTTTTDGISSPNTQTTPAASLPAEQQPIVTAGPPPEQKNKKMLLILLAGLFVLIGGGAAAYLLMAKDDNSTSNTASTSQTVQKKPISLLRYGSKSAMPTTFYPDADSINNGAQFTVMRQIFEGLVGYGDNQKFVPLLASSWTNPDNSTWVFKLKPNVVFHNGNKMTAETVKASLEAATPSSDQYGFASVIKSIEIVDKQTIKITTKQPDALFLSRLVNMFIFDTTSVKANSPDNGTGPFTLKTGSTPSETSTELVAIDNYHATTSLVKEISATSYDDEDALIAAGKQGKVDVFSLTSMTEAKDVIAANNKLSTRQFLAQGSTVLQPLTFTAGSPIQKLAVRQAIYMSIDPALVIKADGGDFQSLDQLVPKTVVGFNPTITRPKLNTEKAKQMLSDAGYPNGFKLSVIYGPPYENAVKEIGRQLESIGVTLEHKKELKSVDFKNDTTSAKYDLSYSAAYSDFFDASDIITVAYTKGGSYGAYDNDQVNKLLATAATEFDAAKRIKTMQDISKLLMDDVALIPIGAPLKTVVQPTNFEAPYDLPDSIVGAYLSKFYSK